MITLYYESRFGLARGAIYYQNLPQLYLEGYEYDPALGVLGTRSVARLKGRVGGIAFLRLADGEDAVLDGAPDLLAKITEGAAVEIEIIAEARGNKLARARLIAPAEGEPRRVSSTVNLRDRLLAQSAALLGERVVRLGDPDMLLDALDDARERAIDPSGGLSNGGHLTIEPTQALIACDIDSAGGDQGMVAGKTFAKTCNELAVADLARRLRLSNQAGLVVVDLIGRRHDGARLNQLLRSGFMAEAERIIVAPIGKFSTLEFVRPWGARPLAGGIVPAGAALYSVNRAVRMAEQARGRVIVLRDRTPVIDVLRPLLAQSLDPLAPMLRLETSDRPEVIAL